MKIEAYWYRERLHPLLLPLLPFSLAFRTVTALRRGLYRLGLKKTHKPKLPIIVVGNITIGGTGKTPFVLWLTKVFQKQGITPGIALRGIGGPKKSQPLLVKPHSNPLEAGDEAVLLAQNTSCPVVACSDRVAAVKMLQELGCEVVLCDDGLQHYRLGRTLEIAMVDGSRFFGNRLHLPAGPLREPLSRLKKVDFIVVNQPLGLPPDSHNRLDHHSTFPMYLELEAFVSVVHGLKKLPLQTFSQKKVHALAGIGNPQRFFEMLGHLGIEIIPHVFPDHHPYQAADLQFGDELDILMTEKDAIKCRLLKLPQEVKERLWYLQVNPEVGAGFKAALLSKLKEQS